MIHRQSLTFLTLGILICLTVFAGSTSAKRETITTSFLSEEIPTESGPVVPPPHVTATAWGIFDKESGNLLHGVAAEEVLPIASVTKLFTAATARRSVVLDQDIAITWSDLNTEGRSGKLVHGMVTTPRALLVPLLIESSNDAGEAIRRTLGESYSVELTTLLSAAHLSATQIVDGSGLSPRNVSTVTELARFYSYLYREYPELLEITKLRLYLRGDTGLVNNNPLREHPQFEDGKHGFTHEAQKTYVGSFLSETGTAVGIVVLGSSDLEADVAALLTYAATL